MFIVVSAECQSPNPLTISITTKQTVKKSHPTFPVVRFPTPSKKLRGGARQLLLLPILILLLLLPH